MVKVNILQLLTVYVLQFVINDRTLYLLFSSYHWEYVEVGLDIDMKFHQEVMKLSVMTTAKEIHGHTQIAKGLVIHQGE